MECRLLCIVSSILPCLSSLPHDFFHCHALRLESRALDVLRASTLPGPEVRRDHHARPFFTTASNSCNGSGIVTLLSWSCVETETIQRWFMSSHRKSRLFPNDTALGPCRQPLDDPEFVDWQTWMKTTVNWDRKSGKNRRRQRQESANDLPPLSRRRISVTV